MPPSVHRLAGAWSCRAGYTRCMLPTSIRRWSTLLIPALLCACTYEEGPLAPAQSYTTRPVYGGTVDAAHMAVGGLASSYGSCTATLIGRRTVLTAAHCVCKDYPFTKPELPLTFTDSRGTNFEVETAGVTPPTSGNFVDRDLAMVRLKKKVPGIVPATVTTQAPTTGETITLVGRGWGGLSEFPGVTRIGTNTIQFVQPQEFGFSNTAGSAICQGDSGGPTYAQRSGQEQIIGVHSAGTADKCGAPYGTGFDVRVDPYHPWIVQQAQGDLYAGEPIDTEPPTVTIASPADGAQVASTVTITVQASDNIAVTRVSLTVDGGDEGTLTAPPFDFAVQGLTRGSHTIVAEAMDAEENTGSASINVALQTGKPFGEACTADTDCASGLCRDEMCTEGCSTLKACPDGFECQDLACIASSSSGCALAPASGAPGAGRPAAPALPGVLLALLLGLGLGLLRRP